MTVSSTSCRFPGCKAEVYMLRYPKTGNVAPIDVESTADGNIAIDLDAGTYEIVPKDERAFRDQLHLNHWATCESPAARRRRG